MLCRAMLADFSEYFKLRSKEEKFLLGCYKPTLDAKGCK